MTGANLTGGQLTGTATDTTLNLSGGNAGFYSSGINTSVRFDDLSITSIPEPATIGMLGLGALVTMLVRRMRK
jgi:hypothetical protein